MSEPDAYFNYFYENYAAAQFLYAVFCYIYTQERKRNAVEFKINHI